MERKRATVLAGAALLVLVGGAWLFGAGGDNAAPPGSAAGSARAAPANPAAAHQPGNGDVALAPPGLDAARPTDCLIEPSAVVRVNSGVEGVIQAIYVDRGDMVREGQVVAQLRADVDRAGAAAAQARASNVHAERAAASRAAYLSAVSDRSQQISEYLARDAVEEAAANARAAQEERLAAAQDRRVAQLESVQTQRILGEKTVRSPVSGIVTERVMSAGEYRGPDASHIVTVARVHPLHVEVFAPIAQLGSIAVGDTLTILPEEPVGGEYQATVTVVDRVFDAASGTFGMRLELPNPDYALPAGLRCTIRFNPPAPARRTASAR